MTTLAATHQLLVHTVAQTCITVLPAPPRTSASPSLRQPPCACRPHSHVSSNLRSSFAGARLENPLFRHGHRLRSRRGVVKRPAVGTVAMMAPSDVGNVLSDLAIHLHLTLGVGVGLPCTVMVCQDVMYRMTLPPPDPFKLTAGGIFLVTLIGAYLWATPGVAPGFWDMFFLAPLDRKRGRQLKKEDLVLGRKLGEGSYGSVYRATMKDNPREELVVKRANEFGAVEIWMNERVRRACRSSCADFVDGFLEPSAKKEEFWLVWRYEGDESLCDVMNSKDFPYNVETSLFGGVLNMPKGAARENRIITALLRQILQALERLHRVGIVHRDIKPQNIIFSRETGLLKIIDLGAAADLRVGINYQPKEFLLDPRYSAPEQYIMSTQTPQAPPPVVATALSPVLWQLNLPDRFDIYSAGLIFMQMAFPGMRSDSGLITFNRQLKRCGYDLTAWREVVEKRPGPEITRGLAIMDLDGGLGWELLQSMIRYNGRTRISAGGSLVHPYITRTELPALTPLARGQLWLSKAAQLDMPEASAWLAAGLAKSGTKKVGGLTEAQLDDMRERDRKDAKANVRRNALAAVMKVQRKAVQLTIDTVGEIPKRGETWWNRWSG